MNTSTRPAEPHAIPRTPMPRVVVAASTGTVFEYYDFMLYGSLATFFGALFFPPGNSTAALLASLATFGAGFAVRPLGAMLFGRLGDRVGRKKTFLVTIVLMGLSTALVGVLPSFESIGWWAPALLVLLRLIQGLALGGEFGGAALYIAEHADAGRRGFFTSWIQTTGTMGLVLSLLVIVACRAVLGDEDFRAWGWRIPFLLSVLLLALSVYVRLKLHESPLFEELKRKGGLSDSPIMPRMIAAIVVSASMAISWYTAQFYSLVFMQTALQLDAATSSLLIVIALVVGIGCYVGAGALSDRVGRRPVMLWGMLFTALAVFPCYRGLQSIGHPQMANAQASAPVTVYAAPTRFDPLASAAELDDATRLRDYLAKRGISYSNAAAVGNQPVVVQVGERRLEGFDAQALGTLLADAGYPGRASLPAIERLGDIDARHLSLVGLILVMVLGAGMTCGPGAAWLAELFPTRIRYTSLSVPYHLTSAWFGGFMPLTAAWLVARSGDVFAGLWYPVIVMGTSFCLSLFLMKETRGNEL
jgi:predicted MFS family arabinose efflux permease